MLPPLFRRHRHHRGQIVEALRDAPDVGAAEELFKVLNKVMAESLVKLRMLPVTASALVSTDIAKAVGALGKHLSARVRKLARNVVRWRSSRSSPTIA
ncbi:hypothetical protein ACP4OV_028186 [Aristida adscensionis]